MFAWLVDDDTRIESEALFSFLFLGTRMGRRGGGYCRDDGIYRSSVPPCQLDNHGPLLSFPEFFFAGPAGSPELSRKLALADCKSGLCLTFSQLRRLVSSLSSSLLRGNHLKQGQVALLLLGNSIYVPVAFHAVLSLGGVVTTMNPSSTAAEISRQVVDSRARIAFTTPNNLPKLDRLGLLLIVLLDIDTPDDVPLLSVSQPSVSGTILRFSDLISGSDCHATPDVQIKQSDPAALLYSSGTTGVSKGVILSHGNLIAALSVLERARGGPLPEDEVRLALLPMFHVAGLVWVAGDVLRSGGTLIILPKFDLADLLEAVQTYKITYLPIVPPVVVALTKSPLILNYDLTSVRTVQSGGSPLGKDAIQAFLAKHPYVKKFEQAYGMTETSGIGIGFAANEPFGSAGRLMPNAEAKILDIETGKSLPPNSKGELLLRGPFVMQGYLNNPKATSETIDKDGWIHTGDLAYFDDNGSMFIVDRLKELIKHKSFQVAPAELEAVLLSHPSIADCAVIPFGDEYAGEIPFAYVVRAAGSSLTSLEVMEFVSARVAPHKKIRRVAFLDTIPKSPSGKILRKLLKEKAQARL